MDLTDQITGAESGGNPTAQNPNSSAGGLGQFIDSTWLDMLKQHRPDIQGSDADLIALKSNPDLSRQMTAAYAADNGKILASAGLPVTPGNTYLAHFAGPQGAVSVLSADPSAPAATVLGPAAVKANPFLANMTAGDVAAWANRKMGGQAAPPAARAPMPLSAPQAPPMFAQPAQQPAQQAAPHAQPEADGGSPVAPSFQAPALAAPPIFATPRKPGTSKLMAAFKAPNFYAKV
jgi:hypothetical protein